MTLGEGIAIDTWPRKRGPQGAISLPSMGVMILLLQFREPEVLEPKWQVISLKLLQVTNGK